MKKQVFAPLLALAIALPACTSETTEVDGETVEVQDTVVGVLADSDGMSTISSAVEATGLKTMFEGPGASYTLLAPNDAAFEALGDEDVPPAILAAVLREHIIPGHLEAGAIADAVKSNDGAVRMSTVGNGEIEFTLDGETLVAKHSDSGQTARLGSTNGLAKNGSVLVVDSVLVTPPSEGPADQS